MIVALGLLAVAVGTVVFHFMSPWWWTPIASNWGYIDDTIILTFWITGAVFIAVVVFMAYCVLRFKYRPEARSEYRPENHKLEWWLTGLTSVGVAAMLIPGLFVWHQYVTVPDDATEVEVLAKRVDLPRLLGLPAARQGRQAGNEQCSPHQRRQSIRR